MNEPNDTPAKTSAEHSVEGPVESPARRQPAKGNPLLEIVVTILVPAVVLMQLSSA